MNQFLTKWQRIGFGELQWKYLSPKRGAGRSNCLGDARNNAENFVNQGFRRCIFSERF